MFSSLEIIAIIVIVCVQLVIAFRVYKQISNLNNFLPNGRHSLSLEEYSVPADKISQLEPSDIVGRIIYRPSYQIKKDDKSTEDIDDFDDEEYTTF